MEAGQKLTKILLKDAGGNVTHLADALSEYAGRKVYRQQVQRWANGAGMNVETFTMLEGYQKFATASLKKKARDQRYRTKKKLK